MEEHRKGLHCLSQYDGDNYDFVRETKKQLKDPDSFQSIETRIKPVDGKNEHIVMMSFRAKNSFGGYVVNTVVGKVNSDSCLTTVKPIIVKE